MEIQPQTAARKEMHRILLTSVAPRPIAWVSSINKDGRPNLAPHSYFNMICTEPAIVGFSSARRQGEDRRLLGAEGLKDTIRNIRETGEFVINVVTYALVEPMNLTSGEYESSVNEFEVARVTMAPSMCVRPPRVGESPIAFECKVYQILEFGTAEIGGTLVLGSIVNVHLGEEILTDGKIDASKIDFVARMGGRLYCRTTDRFEMTRPQRPFQFDKQEPITPPVAIPEEG
jgi:flavin reductase (DIM6/NTAB) family NADH-FMN oxidoreductase RutF